MRRSVSPWAAFAASLALTLGAAGYLANRARRRDAARFGRGVRAAEDRIEARLDAHATLLRGAAGLLAAHPDTTASGFQAYVARLDYPDARAVGFVRRFRRTETGAVESDLQARGFAGLRVWPDLGREERSAVVWIEPLDARNRILAGYDMLADATRREAMERARDTGRAALSGAVAMSREQGAAGFLLFVPVYRGGAVPASEHDRREALLGWTWSAFEADSFFRALFAREPDPAVDLRILDGAKPLWSAGRLPHAGALQRSERMEIFGHPWTIDFFALPALQGGNAPVVMALIIGALLSALVFLLTRRQELARERAENALAGLQRSLEERGRFEERLREEGRINSILRRLGIALAAELDPERVARLVVDEGVALTGAQNGAMLDAAAPHRVLAVAREPVAPPDELAKRILAGERAIRAGNWLAAPVASQSSGLLAGLFFTHASSDHFTEQHERLLLGLAAQAAIALDSTRLLRDLKDADRRKDQFLATLGHELRNPLAPLVTALELARRDPQSSDRQLAIVERQAQHMVRIVDDLLDVARISRGRIELEKQALPVSDALSRAAEAVSPLAQARGQRLTVTNPPEPLLVQADPVRLEQILGNLLTNAVKYTPERGEIALSAALVDGALEVRVSDNGIGIAKDAQATLFEPFVQVPAAKGYATGGLGIGLALVRGLVDLHGGTVRVESEGAGRGSTFVVRLPNAAKGETPREVRKAPQRAARGRVLVVDDNVDAAMTLAEAVRLDGHEVRVAHDGSEALKDAEAFAPEVVLLDIGLPGMDGYEIVSRLRRLPKLARTLMVALTGFGQETDRTRALQAGFDEHLVKPVDLDTVHGVLRRRLG